jgi:hypothetical protein
MKQTMILNKYRYTMFANVKYKLLALVEAKNEFAIGRNK